jgi:predicted peptidase
MRSRRDVLALLSTIPAGALLANHRWLFESFAQAQNPAAPVLAPGAPASPERRALVDDFRKRSAGIEALFESRSFTSDWTMPYRLFRPAPRTSLPLVVYLHGSGGLGNDNLKQMATGNIFGTRLWALPENQSKFPCYVVAPQTDRGWVRYGDPAPGDSIARVVPGLGEGVRLALGIIDALCKEFPIDKRRIYVTGQSMGGAGVWHLAAQRPDLVAAAVPLCATETGESVASLRTIPLWNFHGDADATVPVRASRERIAALRQAGGSPLYTEYPGVGHNSWELAYTEPAVVPWLFSQVKRG